MDITKNELHKVAIHFGFLIGAWPMAYQNNPDKRRWYTFYFILTQIYIICFSLGCYYQLYKLITADVLDMEELPLNMCVTLPSTICVIRAWAIRRPTVITLIRKFLDSEEVILKSTDEEVIQIYNSHVQHNRMNSVIYIVSFATQAVLFLKKSSFVEKPVKYDPITNTTTTLHVLPFSAWFPFDIQEHLKLGYLLCIVDTIFIGAYFVFGDILMFGMIIFPLGQLRILKHLLSNFPKYVSRVKDQLQCDREEASFVTMRECLIKHNDIITYINDYNDSMKVLMLLDFLQSSLQLASLMVQVMIAKNIVLTAICAHFVTCMLIRLLCSYWFANDILVESTELSTALYDSKWYNEPQKVKQLMITFITRTQRPLGLEIGPFATMTLEVFVKIMKTTYSYMMIMYR